MSKSDDVLSLVTKGLHLVPWKNRSAGAGRRPIWSGWNSDTIPSIETITSATTEYPAADWAVVPKGFVVLDCDVKHGFDGVAIIARWCLEANTTIEEVTKSCAITKTFSNGRHFYFRYSGPKTTVNYGKGVEFKCRNQSVHVPPSEGYEWIKPFTEIQDLPELPSFIEERWKKVHEEVRDFHRPKYANGERRLMLCSMAGALRNCSLNESELKVALNAVAHERCIGELDPGEVDKIASDFGTKPIRDVLGSAMAGCEVSKGILRFVIGAVEPPVPAVAVEHNTFITPQIIDRSITHPTPIIGQWVDAVDYNNPMNQPAFGLASAIVGLATLMGRRFVCNGAYANQYVTILGATSTGKNAPLGVLRAIMRKLDCQHLIAASKIASGAGMLKELAVRNELVWTIDEIAFLMRAMASKTANPYLLDLTSQLLQTYSGGVFEGVSKDAGVNCRIDHPYPNILSAAQPSTFRDSMTDQFVESGFLGRFVLFRGYDDYDGKPLAEYKGSDKNPIISDALIDGLRPAIGNWNNALSQAMGFRPDGVNIPITQDGNRDITDYFKTLAEMRRTYDQKGMANVSAAISKNREKLIKFAMLHAFSRNIARPEVDVESVVWARKVLALSDTVLEMHSNNIVRNDVHRNSIKVVDLIEASGPNGITRTSIVEKTRWLKSAERVQMLDDLIEGGTIYQKITKVPNAVRPVTFYYHHRFQPKG